jgi:hypothetical protein
MTIRDARNGPAGRSPEVSRSPVSGPPDRDCINCVYGRKQAGFPQNYPQSKLLIIPFSDMRFIRPETGLHAFNFFSRTPGHSGVQKPLEKAYKKRKYPPFRLWKSNHPNANRDSKNTMLNFQHSLVLYIPMNKNTLGPDSPVYPPVPVSRPVSGPAVSGVPVRSDSGQTVPAVSGPGPGLGPAVPSPVPRRSLAAVSVRPSRPSLEVPDRSRCHGLSRLPVSGTGNRPIPPSPAVRSPGPSHIPAVPADTALSYSKHNGFPDSTFVQYHCHGLTITSTVLDHLSHDY